MGTSNHKDDASVRIIASSNNWIEGDAVMQLEKTANLKGIKHAIGMPDLHAGKGYPVGVAFLSDAQIYPALVGNDIGCGMGLWETELKVAKPKLEKWSSKLYLDDAWEGDSADWLAKFDLPADLASSSLGTIGGGNHFAELQAVEEIHDLEACQSLGLDRKNLYLLVHSGSRGLGQAILANHITCFGHEGLESNSIDAVSYLRRHDQAVRWGHANRALIAHRFLSALRSRGNVLFDHAHNTVSEKKVGDASLWLHRKGASPSDQGALVIPGSRGTFSYLVEPVGDQEGNGFSLAHGAGRKWMRSEAKGRLSAKYRQEDFVKTDLGSRVICEDKSLIFEEAPQAYKNIDVVIQDMVDAGLIRVLATLRPMLTYKTRRAK